MDNLYFTGTNNVFIKWAEIVSTPYEESKKTHLTQFSSIELENYKKIGLDFHYELHMRQTAPFIRFDCHIFEYNNHKNYKSKEIMLDELTKEHKLHLYYIRHQLKEMFEKEFSESMNIEFVAEKFNYFGLLKRNIKNLKYNDAIQESEIFIQDTYDRILKIIESVIC